MPVAKRLGTSTTDAMKSDEGTGSLDTFIRHAVGKEPLFSLSRTGDSSTQWIQLLHTFDQKDLPGWSLLAPMKVQMQKCDKCAREFCSTINYRRHIRVHRRSMNFHKDPQKYKDMLGAFWDKLDYDKTKEIMNFKDVNLEDTPGSSIVKNIAANLRKPNFLSLPQVYVKAGSSLVDIIQGRLSRLPIPSQELFSVLDDASERTFLCAGTAESLKKYVFDGEARKIALETKNLIACTSFLVEQKLVNAWLADKDAEALRCQKLLVEEEEAAQRRQAELLERKRQRKIRQKEQRARGQTAGMKVESYTASDIFESVSSAENFSHQISPVIDHVIPDEIIITPLEPVQLSSHEEAIDHSDPTVNEQEQMNSSQHFIARWQVPKSQRSGHHNSQYGSFPQTADIFESVSSAEISSCQFSLVTDPVIPDEIIVTPLDPVQLSRCEETIDHSSTVNEQQKMDDSSQHFIARRQVPKSQRIGHHNNQNGKFLRWEQPHKHWEQKVNNGGKIWTRKPKPENGVKSRVLDTVNSCQLMIGSISVTVRNSSDQYQVTCPAAEFQESENSDIKTKSVQIAPNCSNVKLRRARNETRGQLADGNKSQILEEDLTSTRGVDQTLTAESSHQSCELNVNSEGINDCSVRVEGDGKLTPFSIDAAKDFLAQRWKEAVCGDHVELIVTSAPEPAEVQDDHQLSDSSNHANKFRTKPKSMKAKYIPKQRPVY